MINFLEAKKILYKNQFGFRHKSSTTDSLICLTENIRVALDSEKLACGIFISLQKAFDTVDHEILLDKLQNCGFRGIYNIWLWSYLTGREQFVHIGGKNSSMEFINLTFLWTWTMRWVPRSFVTHASLCNTLPSNKMSKNSENPGS